MYPRGILKSLLAILAISGLTISGPARAGDDTTVEYAYCTAASGVAVYVSDVMPLTSTKPIAGLSDQWGAAIRKVDSQVTFTHCTHLLMGKQTTYAERDRVASTLQHERGLLRVIHTGWID